MDAEMKTRNPFHGYAATELRTGSNVTNKYMKCRYTQNTAKSISQTGTEIANYRLCTWHPLILTCLS